MSAESSTTQAAIERVADAGRDAITSETMALIDRVKRSGLDGAIPVLAEMVNNGDLARLAQLARVIGSAEDALTDEMVVRLTGAVSGGLELIDQVNRSGLDRALPVLSRLVADGDLERIGHLARVVGSIEDALTDDMVNRLAGTLGEGLNMADRLTRGGFARLVGVVEQLEASGALERLVETLPRLVEHTDKVDRLLGCLDSVVEDEKTAPKPAGGIGGLWTLVRSVDAQSTLHFMLALGGRMRRACGRGA